MTVNWKIIIPLGLIVIVGIVLVYSQLTKPLPQVAPGPGPAEIPPAEIPPAEMPPAEMPTGPEVEEPVVPPVSPAEVKIDDEVNALIAAFSADQTALADEEGDASLITADSQALSDLGQSYDEKEF